MYEDFICQQCAITCSFLKLYPAYIWAMSKQNNAPSVSNAENVVDNGSLASRYPDKNEDNVPAAEILGNSSSSGSKPESVSTKEESVCDKGTEINVSSEDTKPCHENQELSAKCIIGVDINVSSVLLEKMEPMFLSKKWRELLCKCGTCYAFYTRNGIEYLTDKEDTIEAYEKMAKSKREEKLKQQEGAELNFLNTLNHVQKIEILSGIADMKNEFRTFLVKIMCSIFDVGILFTCPFYLNY